MVKWIITRPITVTIICLVCTVLGILATFYLPISFMPELNSPVIMVEVVDPTAEATEIEERISSLIETELTTVQGIEHIQTISRKGMSVVLLHLAWGSKMDEAQLIIREKLSRLEKSFPASAERPLVRHLDPSQLPLIVLAINANESAEESYRVVDQFLKKRLEQLEGIARVQVEGMSAPVISIKLNTRKMYKLGISPEDVKEKLESVLKRPIQGQIRMGHLTIPLTMTLSNTSQENLHLISIKVNDGQIVRLNEIAEIKTEEFNKTESVFFNGTRVILLNVLKTYASSGLDVVAELKKTLVAWNNEYPNLKIQIVRDDSEFIKNSLNNVAINILQGSSFAFLILFLFLKTFRHPLQIAISIPVSIVLTLAVLYLLDIGLNILTLGGLALSVGLLEVNAIVVLENIFRLQEMGKPLREAVIEGTEEVVAPVLGSTLTSIAVFAPFFILPGFAGALFHDQALTILIALSFSGLVSLTLLPFLFYIMERSALLKSEKVTPTKFLKFSPKPTLLWLNQKTDLCNNLYHKSLNNNISKHKKMISISLITLFIAIFSIWILPKTWLPKTERDNLVLKTTFRNGTPFKEVEASSRIIEHKLSKIFGVERVVTYSGTISKQLGDEGYLRSESVDYSVKIPIKLQNQFKIKSDSILKTYDLISAGYSFQKTSYETLFENLESQDIWVINSEKLEILEDSWRKISKEFPNLERINYEQINSVQLKLDLAYCAAIGINLASLEKELAFYTKGDKINGQISTDSRTALYLITESDNDLETLLQKPFSSNGKTFFLKNIAKTEQISTPFIVEKQSHSFIASLKLNDTNPQLVKDYLLKKNLDVSFMESRETREIASMLRNLAFIFLLSVLAVFVILATEFNSIKIPLLILTTVIMGVGGAGLALIIGGDGIHVFSLTGIIILVGLVTGDAIVKIEFIEQKRREGINLLDAIFEGSAQRFRPIVMNTLTAIIAVLPLLFDRSEGYEFQYPLALTLFGGLTISTFLTLYLIPYGYYLIERKNQ